SDIEVGSEISIIVSKGEKEIETNDYEESIEVPFEPEDDEEEQEVVIYIDDLDNKLTDVYKKEVITKDTEFKIKLKIEEDKNAEKIEIQLETKDKEKEKKVVIYIDDLDNKLTDVYKKEVITKDTEFKIKLKIEEDKNAEYKIERDCEEFTKKTISYKEGS